MEILDAIKEAHAGKYAGLDVRQRNGRYYWSMNEDIGYCNYIKARDYISSYRKLEWLLRFLKII